MARSAEYDIVPDYDKLLDIMTAAKREGLWRLGRVDAYIYGSPRNGVPGLPHGFIRGIS